MKIILSSLLLLCGYGCMACDVCGVSGNSSGLGVLPQFNSHFIGLQYQQRIFHTTHTSLHEGNAADNSDEYYRTLQLWGGVSINRRIQLFVFLPYQYNTQKMGGVDSKYSGLGDASILGNVTIIKTPLSSKKEWKHLLMAGAGLKAPTGKRYVDNAATDSILNIQPGTGSWDILLNTNYTLRYKNVGLNVECAYTITTANHQDYKFGNRLSSGIQLFYGYQKGRITIMPQAGVKMDYVLHDYNNYSRKWLNEETGGYMMYTTIGVQAFYKHAGVQCNYSSPVSQHYAAGLVNAKHKFDAGLLFVF